MKRISMAVFLLLTLTANISLGQLGVSSMSVGRARADQPRYTADGRYRMPTPDNFRVEEFVNYHLHDLPLPEKDQRVRLHVQRESNSRHSFIQFGITTPRDLDPETIQPLNLVLVIDRSGSMSGERIARVKEAILAFAERLRECDRLSICTFSNRANLEVDGVRGSEYADIESAVNAVNASGGTNLHAGLMLGYETAKRHFDEERTNRVLLLTDGRTNLGEVDPEKIARQSRTFNRDGIDLSTIGLGDDLNVELLRELADSGRGLAHFIGDSEDIKKTFVHELESLLAPAARKVKLVIDFGDNPTPKVYGYTPKLKKDELVFKLDDLNHGATQVVITRLKTDLPEKIDVRLSYTDAITAEKITIEQTLDSGAESSDEVEVSIQKNVAIAYLADSIRKASISSNGSECEKAERQLTKGIKSALEMLDLKTAYAGDDQKECTIEDPDVTRVYEIASRYQREIRECIERGQRD